MLCDLQIFSGCVCHLEQLHALSPFLFPIVFSINFTSIYTGLQKRKWKVVKLCSFGGKDGEEGTKKKTSRKEKVLKNLDSEV